MHACLLFVRNEYWLTHDAELISIENDSQMIEMTDVRCE